MKALLWTMFFVSAVFLSACAAGSKSMTGSGGNGEIDLRDPTGDDKGPGTFTYPSDAVYKKGSFDLTRVQIVPTGDTVEFRISVDTLIEDPWQSSNWGGNGFSVQMGFVFIDTDHQAASGVQDGLPGLNIRFKPEEAWDRVVLLSPQGATRLNSEIEEKCPQWKDRVIVPQVTRVSGRTLIAVVGKAQLGALPGPGWGYQVAIQSNEGFPAKSDLLIRKVNEYEGQHRFGGGTDYDNDPQVLDILVPPAKGGPDEVKAQFDLLSKYNRQATTEVKPEDLAVVPMVYPNN